jgi:diaminohydroxyphosphoribosylaminopyrimidine deaminase/5-amino-6-(5-phosphoribosylamino)uracil reductase
MANSADILHLRRALRLALRGQGRVEPNPMVGCVIVRDGKVIGEGWHARFGGPHAEVRALGACSRSPHGATAYVTLEPCCIFSKTPPCTAALIAARVSRVVACVADPNPRIAGRGFRMLRRSGIAVELGVLADEGAELIAPFTKLVKTGRPWVILKWAQSLDGVIATRTGDSKWISDETCRAHAHRTRGRVDAIIVGVNTVLCDDPLLTCRFGTPRRIATRIVLDSSLRTPLRSALVRSARQTPTWVVCGPRASESREAKLVAAGCIVRRLPAGRAGIALSALLNLLGAQGMSNVLVEGGGRVLGRFADDRLADEFHIYTAPLLLGGAEAIGALHGVGPARMRDHQKLRILESRRIGEGWFHRARGRKS